MYSLTEHERYRVLAGVHMWHLEHGEQKRDWDKIGELAEVTKRETIFEVFIFFFVSFNKKKFSF